MENTKVYQIMGKIPELDWSADNVFFVTRPLTGLFTEYPAEQLKMFQDTVLPEEKVWVTSEKFAPVKVWVKEMTLNEEPITAIGKKVEEAYQKRQEKRLLQEDYLIEIWT